MISLLLRLQILALLQDAEAYPWTGTIVTNADVAAKALRKNPKYAESRELTLES